MAQGLSLHLTAPIIHNNRIRIHAVQAFQLALLHHINAVAHIMGRQRQALSVQEEQLLQEQLQLGSLLVRPCHRNRIAPRHNSAAKGTADNPQKLIIAPANAHHFLLVKRL